MRRTQSARSSDDVAVDCEAAWGVDARGVVECGVALGAEARLGGAGPGGVAPGGVGWDGTGPGGAGAGGFALVGIIRPLSMPQPCAEPRQG